MKKEETKANKYNIQNITLKVLEWKITKCKKYSIINNEKDGNSVETAPNTEVNRIIECSVSRGNLLADN